MLRRDSAIAIIAAPPLTVGPVLGRPPVLPWSANDQPRRGIGEQAGRLIADPSPYQLQRLGNRPARPPHSISPDRRVQPSVAARPRPPLTEVSEQFVGTPYAAASRPLAEDQPGGQSADSVRQSADSVRQPADSVRQPADSVRQPADSVGQPAEFAQPGNPNDLSSWISQSTGFDPEQAFVAPQAAVPAPVAEAQDDNQDWYPEFKQRYLEMKARGELKQLPVITPEAPVERDRVEPASMVRRTLSGNRKLGLGAPLTDGADSAISVVDSTEDHQPADSPAGTTASPADSTEDRRLADLPTATIDLPAEPVEDRPAEPAEDQPVEDQPADSPVVPAKPSEDHQATGSRPTPQPQPARAQPSSPEPDSTAGKADSDDHDVSRPRTQSAQGAQLDPELPLSTEHNDVPDQPSELPSESPVQQSAPPGGPTSAPLNRPAGRQPEAASMREPAPRPSPLTVADGAPGNYLAGDPMVANPTTDEPAGEQQVPPATSGGPFGREPVVIESPFTDGRFERADDSPAIRPSGSAAEQSSADEPRAVAAEPVITVGPRDQVHEITEPVPVLTRNSPNPPPPSGTATVVELARTPAPLAPSAGERSRSSQAVIPSQAHPTVRYSQQESTETLWQRPRETWSQPSYYGTSQQPGRGSSGTAVLTPRPTATLHRLPPQVATGLSTVLSADVTATRVVRGPWVNDAARSMKARAFTQQGKVFLPDDAGPLDSGPARSLLAHELTHLLQIQQHGHIHESGVQPDELEQQALAAESAISGDGPATMFSWRHPALIEDDAEPELPSAEPARTRRAATDLAAPTAAAAIAEPDIPAWGEAAPEPDDDPQLDPSEADSADYHKVLEALTGRLDELDLAMRNKLSVVDDQDEAALARRLFGHLHGRLRTEFVLERERAGRQGRF